MPVSDPVRSYRIPAIGAAGINRAGGAKKRASSPIRICSDLSKSVKRLFVENFFPMKRFYRLLKFEHVLNLSSSGTKERQMNNQLRGHCQICGRQQAVPNGHMSHHGYRVRNGWFEGVCNGHSFAPIEKDRDVLDRMCDGISKDCAKLEAEVAALEAGSIDPDYIGCSRREVVGGRWQEVQYPVPYCYGDAYEQRVARARLISSKRYRAEQGRSFVAFMVNLADAVNGKPLMEVERKEAPAPLASRVIGARGVMRMKYAERGRVYWQDERGFSSWMGAQSWRKMPKAD